MKKEVIIAVTLGLLAGLVIAVGMLRARNAIEQQAITPAILLPDGLATPTSTLEQASIRLTIAEPKENFFSEETQVRVSGQTIPATAIVVLQSKSEIVTVADEQGNFSVSIDLVNGPNILVVRALFPDGTSEQRILSGVVAKPKAVASPSATPR